MYHTITNKQKFISDIFENVLLNIEIGDPVPALFDGVVPIQQNC